ncbi:hypothetical protein EJB05_25757, partial [Eragrostis curvula]
MAQLQVTWLLLLLCPALVCSRVPMAMPTSTPQVAFPGLARVSSLPGCSSMCGSISIPYPFGIGDGCSWNKSFNMSCDHSYNPPRAYIGKNVEVMDILLDAGELRVVTPIAHICYNSSRTTTSNTTTGFNNNGSPFLISAERNEFTGIGCHTLVFLMGMDRDRDAKYMSGCITTCSSVEKAANDGERCTGLGCCQTSAIPSGLDVVHVIGAPARQPPSTPLGITADVAMHSWRRKDGVAFLTFLCMRFIRYKFSRKHLNSAGEMPFHEEVGKREVPLVIDWAISKDDGRACVSNHSESFNVDSDKYRCRCLGGYAGNPYVDGGCQNIDECQDPTMYPCPSASTCVDTVGNYTCNCKFGRKGQDCRPIFPAAPAAVLGTHMLTCPPFLRTRTYTITI